MCFSLIVMIIKLLEIGTRDNTYSTTRKTVNTYCEYFRNVYCVMTNHSKDENMQTSHKTTN